MKATLLLLCCLVPGYVVAQEKTYDIAFSYGGYTSTMLYHPNQFKTYVAADFTYHLSHRWSISSGFLTGSFGYYNGYPVQLADGTYSDQPNSQGYDLHGYAMAHYGLVATPRFSLQLGAGVGLYTNRLVYPYDGITYEAYYADFEVPISIEGYYVISGRVGIGIKAGCFVQPRTRGLHVGPQLRIRL